MASSKACIFILSLLQLSIEADHIICNTTHPCTEAVACAEDGDCLIECIGDYACNEIDSMACAKNGSCVIRCNGLYACNNGNFICGNAPHTCTVECEGAYACADHWFNGFTGGNFVVECILPDISSDGGDVCQWGTVNCPSAPYTCNVTCYGCYLLDIKAQASGGLTVHSLDGGDHRYADIYCPTGNYPCVITMNAYFRDGRIWGGGGDLVLEMDGSMSQSSIYCPTDAACNITCTAGGCMDSCSALDARAATVLNLRIATNISVAGGDCSSWQWIKCPVDEIGASRNCNFFVSSANGLIDLTNIKIHAVEGVHDLRFICDNADGNCTYFGDASHTPRIYCLEDYSAGDCVLNRTPIDNEWKCVSNASICNTYLLPTPVPTQSPTTFPTFPTAFPSAQPTVDPTREPSVETLQPTEPSTAPTTFQTTPQTENKVGKPGLPYSQMVLLFWAFGLVVVLLCIVCGALVCWLQMRNKALKVQLNIVAASTQPKEVMESDVANSQDVTDANSQDVNDANSQVVVGARKIAFKTRKWSDTPKMAKKDEDDVEEKEKELEVFEEEEGVDSKELMVWMKDTVGLEQYTKMMIACGYGEISSLRFMTLDDLEEVGIANLEHRSKIYVCAQEKCQEIATNDQGQIPKVESERVLETPETAKHTNDGRV
eukprot:72208_1